jgi:hypothetical protein
MEVDISKKMDDFVNDMVKRVPEIDKAPKEAIENLKAIISQSYLQGFIDGIQTNQELNKEILQHFNKKENK